MIPRMSQRDMAKAMKKLGIKEENLDAIAVIIRTKDEDIIIRNPSVSRVNMMGSWTYQVSGEEERRRIENEPEFSEEDVKTVMEQAGCSEEKAKEALTEANGDLAQAILSMQ